MILQDNEENKQVGKTTSLKKWWAGFSPKKKQSFIILLASGFVVVIALFGYAQRKHHKVQPRQETTKPTKTIQLNQNLIEKSLYSKVRENDIKRQKVLADMQAEIKKLKNQAAAMPPQTALSSSAKPSHVLKQQSIPPRPPRPPGIGHISMPNQIATTYTPPPPVSGGGNSNRMETLGGIEQVVNTVPETPKIPDSKKKFKIFLPPSFMEATLLSGVDAVTTSEGKNNPVPILIRINNLAILPNMVKANLKGCFVLGEGKGDLSTERVDVRLRTLSCVSRNGEAVIDQAVKGYVVDGDGKAGLRGVVTAKMGALLARSAFAGFLGGVGDAMQTSTQNTQQTALGTQQKIWNNTDTKNLVRGGIGGGVSSAATELEKFYLQLAQQTLPIIQVGATKTITVVISDGVNLEVKNESLVK